MHIHVFTIDILPSKATVSTGGGIRSHQIIEGLKRQGFTVTYSVPRVTDLAKRNWGKLSREEQKNAYSFDAGSTYEDILGRLKPDVVVCLWPHTYTFPRYRMEGPLIVHDANGLQNVEGALFRMAIGMTGISLQALTKEYMNKLITADILICGSLEQKGYWSGLLSFQSDSFSSPEMIRLPYYPASEPLPDDAYDVGKPTFFCTGAFLPWNSPEGHLLASALLLRDAGLGELYVIGKPEASMSHAATVNRELDALRKFDFVHLLDGVPYPELSAMMNNRGIAIDLNTRTLEREFAVPIRTVNYLAHGVPVITNNYSVIGHEVATFDAGWCVDPNDSAKFRETFGEVLATPIEKLKAKSFNARRLAKDRFYAEDGFALLKERILSKTKERSRKLADRTRRNPTVPNSRPCVLIVTEDHENFLELRIRIPFDAMYKAGLIKGYHVLSSGKIVRSVGVREDIQSVDAIWVQRDPSRSALFVCDTFDGQFVYDIDDNMLGTPSYRLPFSPQHCTLIRSLLRHSGAVTTTSARLAASLQRLSGEQIEQKTVIAPNVTDKVDILPGSNRPDALLIASSDRLALTTSLQPFLQAIEKFCRAKELPLFYIGTPVNDLTQLGLKYYRTGMQNYETYRDYIRLHNLMAVAPLEAWGDAQTQDFVNCKSDIKMVEFGSMGVPAVYADVAPYRETPLRGGPLVDMGDESALFDALDNVYSNIEKWRKQAAESVLQHRLACNVVGESWFQAILNTRLTVPVELNSLLERYEAFSKFSREWAAAKDVFIEEDYLVQNPDVANHAGISAYDHYASEGIRSGRTWFPASTANAQELMLRVRESVFREDQALTGLEQRVARAIQATTPPPKSDESAAPVSNPETPPKTWRSGLRKAGLKLGIVKYPPLFDPVYYLSEYADVKQSGMNPYLHYILHGIVERRNPNKFFNTAWYLQQNPDADKPDVDPLDHYMREGAARGLDPSPHFSTSDYMGRHPELEKTRINPLQHFLSMQKQNSR